MTERLANHLQVAPEGIKAMQGVEAAIARSGLEKALLNLVKTRASQINACAFCLDMHVVQARQQGETDMRLHMLPAWRESSLYSDRERAALAWTEALTLVAQTGAPDADYARIKTAFTPAEQVNLTLAIGAINLWNRLQVGFRAAPVEQAADAG
jgi:AhpD family alkylhydroperoxidase